MTSAGLASSSFSAFSMADDSMEMSSDHGGLNATDDIDIDIDFTAGTVDDDYMVEDRDPEGDVDFTETDVEFKESYDSGPQTFNDDVMVDDYNTSFNMEEVHDEDEQLRDVADETLDVPQMELSNNEAPESHGTDRRGSNHSTQELTFNDFAQQQGSAAGNALVDVSHGMPHTGSASAVGTFTSLNSAAHPSLNSQSGVSGGANLLPHSPDHSINQASTKSLSEKEISDEATESHVNDGDEDHAGYQAEAAASFNTAKAEDEVVEEEVAEDTSNAEQLHSIDTDAKYDGIMVSYLDTTYALFSSSEDEDSDSFFLKDRSITQEPISSFLSALRDILQEELNDDAELCIAIDVLGLEFGERSAEIDKVTFEELIRLYQQLVQNDGIDSPEPLHFTLGTRPEFARRFVGLLAGASEGKGLSELIPRDMSESFDEVSTNVGEGYDLYDQKEDDLHLQADGLTNNAEEGARDEHSADQDETAASASLELSEENAQGESKVDVPSIPHNDSHVEDISTANEDQKEEHEVDSNGLVNVTIPPSNEDVEPGSDKTAAQESEAKSKTTQQQYDEDDLIDYSDDELENTKPEIAKTKALPSDTSNACNEIFIASIKAKNEDLRRQSISRASEAAENASTAIEADGKASTIPDHRAEISEPQPADDTYDAGEIDFGLGEDTNDLETASNHSSQKAEELVDDIHSNHDGQDKFEDDYYTGFDDQEEQEGGQTYDFEDRFENENVDEIDIGVEGQDLTTEPGTLRVATSADSENGSLKSNATSPHEVVSADSVTVSGDTVDEDEIDYVDYDVPPVDTVEKAVTSDVHNAQEQLNSTKTEDIDEIDYDDDDVGDIAPQTPSAAPLQSASSSTPGKRQRSDSMSEVAPGEEIQEAKRVRS